MSCILLTCYCITRLLHDTVYIINAVQIPTNTIFSTNTIFLKSKKHFCCVYTSSASVLSFSTQDSKSDKVSRISPASSLMRLAPSLMLVKALSRSFLIWMSRVVRLEWPSSSGVGKLKESRQNPNHFSAAKKVK